MSIRQRIRSRSISVSRTVVRRFSPLLFTTMLGAANLASAAIVDEGATTFDSSTGLYWLDLTSTYDLSYNAIQSQFVAGGRFAGYRYATLDEADAFFDDAGIPISSVNPSDYQVTQGFAQMLGAQHIVGDNVDNWFLQGFTDPSFSGDAVGYAKVEAYVLGGVKHSDRLTTNNFGLRDFADPGYGSFLVRDVPPVPEPSTFLLLLVGLAVVGRGTKSVRAVASAGLPTPSIR